MYISMICKEILTILAENKMSASCILVSINEKNLEDHQGRGHLDPINLLNEKRSVFIKIQEFFKALKP